MTRRAEERLASSAERQNDGELNGSNGRADSEQIEDTVEAEANWGERPEIDAIRLRAYYRYLERENGNADEIADWLAAESELRRAAEAGRAGGPEGAPS